MVTTDQAKQAAVDCFEGINERDMDRAVSPFADDAVFEFIGDGPGRAAGGPGGDPGELHRLVEGASPEIDNRILGMTVDDCEPADRKTVAVEWDQYSTDPDGHAGGGGAG